MTVVALDGFDPYNGTGANTGLQAKWTAILNNTSSLVTGRFSGQALQTSGAGCHFGRSLPSSYASFACGFAFRNTVAHTGTPAMCWTADSSGTFQVGLRHNQNGSLEAFRLTAANTGTSLGASSAGVIILNTWHYIEVEVTISDTVGVFKAYVDGTQVLNLTAVDTRNGSPTDINRIGLGLTANAANNGTVQFDDLYVVDAATKLGERRVEYKAPSADVVGATDFTPSTGTSHYPNVDDATANGDTDYNQGSTVGNTDRYTHSGLSSTPATIDAVQVVTFAEKTDATARSIALQVKSGSTTSDGSNFTLASSYGRFERLLTTDPDTSAAWTASGVNNLEFGNKVTV